MKSEIQLRNEQVRIRILPERGGKIASVFDLRRSFELLYQPAGEYPPLRPGMAFSDGDASGFDDVFPSMGERWRDPVSGQEPVLPDHGEIWTSRMTVDAVTEETVRMHTFGQCFPFRYDKELTLLPRGVRERITVTGLGKDPFPCLWVCHCLMRYEAGMRFEFPEAAEAIECVPGCSWPPEGAVPSALSELPVPPPSGTMMKFWFREPVKSGECRAVYPGSGVQAILRFAPKQLPYLGFWMTNGGYRGEHNFAFEPASGYYDTLEKAKETGTLPLLRPGESKIYETEIEIGLPFQRSGVP
ncbi:MAG: hypothetical protein J6U01_10285 [Clostridia bacterium]|nr:hypothetical protein [Clostridia bacterium]